MNQSNQRGKQNKSEVFITKKKVFFSRVLIKISTMLIELDKFLELAVNSERNEVNCRHLNLLLREIIQKVNLAGHSIEVGDEMESSSEQQETALMPIKQEEDENILVAPVSKQLEFVSNNFDASSIRRLSEEIVCVRNSEQTLSAFFDVVNIVKRIDALEIGIRLLGAALQDLRKDESDELQVNRERRESSEQIDSKLSQLQSEMHKLNNDFTELTLRFAEHAENVDNKLVHEDVDDDKKESSHEVKVEILEEPKVELNNNQENRENHQDIITKNLEESLTSLRSDVNDIKLSIAAVQQDDDEEVENQFMKSVNKQLETFRHDLTHCLSEIQSMMDCKVDKCQLADLQTFIDERIIAEESTRIGEGRMRRRAAAGTARPLIRDVNCISCGDNATQIDTTTTVSFPAATRMPFRVATSSTLARTRHCGDKSEISNSRR